MSGTQLLAFCTGQHPPGGQGTPENALTFCFGFVKATLDFTSEQGLVCRPAVEYTRWDVIQRAIAVAEFLKEKEALDEYSAISVVTTALKAFPCEMPQ